MEPEAGWGLVREGRPVLILVGKDLPQCTNRVILCRYWWVRWWAIPPINLISWFTCMEKYGYNINICNILRWSRYIKLNVVVVKE